MWPRINCKNLGHSERSAFPNNAPEDKSCILFNNGKTTWFDQTELPLTTKNQKTKKQIKTTYIHAACFSFGYLSLFLKNPLLRLLLNQARQGGELLLCWVYWHHGVHAVFRSRWSLIKLPRGSVWLAKGLDLPLMFVATCALQKQRDHLRVHQRLVKHLQNLALLYSNKGG